MATNSEAPPPHYRWNFTAFVVDYASFLIAFGFVSSISVLPAFVRQLTASAPLIGLASTIFNLGWTLPQLATAQLIKDRPRKKPFFYIGVPFRATLFVIAGALWAGLAARPAAMLVLFFLCLGLFALSDGFISLSWFEIMARVIPPKKRGLLVAVSQFTGGLAGIGVGILVGLILGGRPFPYSYALLFTLAGIAMIPSTIALLLIREPPPEEESGTATQARGNWLQPLVRDRDFRRLMVCRILVGMTSLATPFYVSHAADVVNLPESIIGRFVIATTVGSLASSVVFGYLSARSGTRLIVRLSSVVALTVPLLALLIHLAGFDWLAQAYPVVYVGIGISTSAWMLGFTNYMLEIVPPATRPAYVGLGNTLMGLMAVVPALGGWLLEATSYTVLFATAAAVASAGALLTLTLRSAETITRVRAT